MIMAGNDGEKPQPQASASQPSTVNEPIVTQGNEELPNPNIQAPAFQYLTEGTDPKKIMKK